MCHLSLKEVSQLPQQCSNWLTSLYAWPWGALSHTDPGLECVICFGQWKNTKHCISRELKRSSDLGFALLLSLGILRMPCEWARASLLKKERPWGEAPASSLLVKAVMNQPTTSAEVRQAELSQAWLNPAQISDPQSHELNKGLLFYVNRFGVVDYSVTDNWYTLFFHDRVVIFYPFSLLECSQFSELSSTKYFIWWHSPTRLTLTN